MAMVHISMAFPLIRRLLLLFGMANTKLYVGCTAGTVLAFALVYGLIYSMTARSYYKIVEKHKIKEKHRCVCCEVLKF